MRFTFSAFMVVSAFLVGHAAAQGGSAAQSITAIVNKSGCSRLGESSPDYIRGMALVYARALCHPEQPEAQVASEPPSNPVSAKNPSDATSVYNNEFQILKIPNKPDADTMLRHTYVLLTALGFKESSGRYCVGRYTAQGFSRSDEAEAGPFQTSWGARKSGTSLGPLFRAYQKDQSQCLLDVFKDHAKCSPTDAKNWNSEGSKDLSGVEWQDLTKKCPAFAAEYASVVIRKLGGAHGEFGPIKCYAGTQPASIQKSCQKVKIYPVCDSMFSDVAAWIKANPDSCKSLSPTLK